jgi:hypothetical protein
MVKRAIGFASAAKKKISREFIRFKEGKFYWIDKEWKEHDIELMEDNHLFNAIAFLYDWAADKEENRNLELSIMVHEERRRDELKKTEAGKLLYTV